MRIKKTNKSIKVKLTWREYLALPASEVLEDALSDVRPLSRDEADAIIKFVRMLDVACFPQEGE